MDKPNLGSFYYATFHDDTTFDGCLNITYICESFENKSPWPGRLYEIGSAPTCLNPISIVALGEILKQQRDLECAKSEAKRRLEYPAPTGQGLSYDEWGEDSVDGSGSESSPKNKEVKVSSNSSNRWFRCSLRAKAFLILLFPIQSKFGFQFSNSNTNQLEFEFKPIQFDFSDTSTTTN